MTSKIKNQAAFALVGLSILLASACSKDSSSYTVSSTGKTQLEQSKTDKVEELKSLIAKIKNLANDPELLNQLDAGSVSGADEDRREVIETRLFRDAFSTRCWRADGQDSDERC